MKKIYFLLGTIFFFCSLLLNVSQALAQDTWTVYDASVMPNEATPAFVPAGVQPAISETAPAVVASEQSIIDNPDSPGGKVLSFKIDNNPHTVFLWRQNFVTLEQDPTNLTVAVRAKGLPDVTRVLEMDLDFGGNRETVYINSNGTFTFNVTKGDNQNKSLGENFNALEWHTYRFTKGPTSVSLYVDENPTPVGTATLAAGTRSEKHFRFGDGNSSVTYGALFDWVAWDITGAYSPSQKPLPDMGGGTTTPKKVAYITTPKTSLVEGAAPTNNDPIIRMLNADPNIELTVMEVAADATIENLGDFDGVIVQESFGSGANILKPAGSLGLANIPVPFIYNKSYALRSSGAIPGGTGAASEAPGTAITVPTDNRSNDLFKGITVVNDTVQIFRTTSDDNGNPGIKSFNFSSGLEISNPNTLLATHAGITNTQNTVFINDIPAGTTFGPATALQTLQARMIALGMNFGAMVKDNGANWTAEGLTLWRNAVYSLVGLPVPTTLVNPNVVTSLATETRNAAFNLGQNYPNPFNGTTRIEFELKKASYVTLEVYDITGKRVALLADGAKTAGIHEVKLETNLKNGIYFYRLNANGATATRKMVVAQ